MAVRGISFDVGVSRFVHQDATPQRVPNQSRKSLQPNGEAPKVHLEEVFDTQSQQQRILDLLLPDADVPELDTPAGYYEAMVSTLDWFNSEIEARGKKNCQSLIKAAQLITEYQNDLTLLNAHRLALIKV